MYRHRSVTLACLWVLSSLGTSPEAVAQSSPVSTESVSGAPQGPPSSGSATDGTVPEVAATEAAVRVDTADTATALSSDSAWVTDPPATAPESVAAELAAPSPGPVQATPAEPEGADATPPVVAAWGRGLTFHADDDRFSLQIRGRIQLQGFVESGVSASDPASVDFMIRRARLVFRGHLLSADLEYYVQLGLAPRDMEPDLLVPVRDANIAWTAIRDLNLRVGVMKTPWNRERVISSSALQLVDRSIVNAELSLDRDNGVQIYSNDLFGLGGYLGYQLGVFGGDGRLRVNNDLGLLWVARLQVQPFGRFDDQLSEADLTRQQRARLSIGAGFAYNEDTNRRRRTTTDFYRAALTRFSYMHAEADLIFKFAGFSLQSEFLWRQVDGPSRTTNPGPDGMEITETAGNAMGWFVQAGYLFDFAPVEIAARVAEIYPVGPADQTANHFAREVTVGFNWYPMGHDLKLQLDGSYLVNERVSMGTSRMEERFQARLQAQAYF
ncbi:MAG: porin [Deltaproteobacteria bacterium]